MEIAKEGKPEINEADLMVSQTDERVRIKRQRSELAIQLAMQGRWEEAAKVNQTLTLLFPSDPEAYNRLGKALAELGQYGEARNVYGKCLELDPHNVIARKNLARLSSLAEEEMPKESSPQKLSPQMFIEEMGKTGSTVLLNPDWQAAAGLSAGHEVTLVPDAMVLWVDTLDRQRLGSIEPKMAGRLLKLMAGGNRYIAAIAAVDRNEIKVFIREVYQDASQAGKVSFPPTITEGFRPYTKGRLLRQDDDLAGYFDDSGDGDWDGDEPAEADLTIVEVRPRGAAGLDVGDEEEGPPEPD